MYIIIYCLFDYLIDFIIINNYNNFGDIMEKDCLFCKIVNGEIPSYTIYEDDDFKVFLDINPNDNGHMLIVPKKHIKDALDIDDETYRKLNSINKKMINLLNDKLNPDGIKLSQNNGILQDVKHYHMHVIPAYKSNEIMSVEDVYKKLKN